MPAAWHHLAAHRLIDYNQFCGVTALPPQPADFGWEIDPLELKKLIDRKEPFYLLDVRETHEWQICRIAGAHLIPLGQLPANLQQLNSADNIVAYCRSGVRSGQAVDILKSRATNGSGILPAEYLHGLTRLIQPCPSIVAPSGMVETPRLQAKDRAAKSTPSTSQSAL